MPSRGANVGADTYNAPSGPNARWKAATLEGIVAKTVALPSPTRSTDPDRSPTNNSPARSNAIPQATPRSVATVSTDPLLAMRCTLPSKRLDTYRRPSRIDGHRRRVGQPRDERLARAIAAHDVDRHGRFLAARSAEGDVEVAVAIEGGAVDLVHASRDRRANLDVGRFAGRAVDADRRVPAVEAWRDDDGQRLTRGVRDGGLDAAKAYLGRLGLEAEAVAADGDASAFDGPQWAHRCNPGCRRRFHRVRCYVAGKNGFAWGQTRSTGRPGRPAGAACLTFRRVPCSSRSNPASCRARCEDRL